MYGVDYRELARRNGIADPSRIYVGQRILVPGAGRGRSLDTRGALGAGIADRGSLGRTVGALGADLASPVRYGGALGADLASPGRHDGALGWPVDGARVGSGFGPRGRSFHDGIDIMAPEGSSVYAVRAGRVVHSGWMSGYGRVVILEHEGGWQSLYAHNSRNLVREGATVSGGTRIAYVGRSGRTTASHLHFEIRRRGAARDPLGYLPPRSVAEAAW